MTSHNTLVKPKEEKKSEITEGDVGQKEVMYIFLLLLLPFF
jgi:hypothetical protein